MTGLTIAIAKGRLQDEALALFPRSEVEALSRQALLFEEFLAQQHAAGRLNLPLVRRAGKQALLHGHCHQKAFGAMSSVERVVRLIPGLEVETVASSCCAKQPPARCRTSTRPATATAIRSSA